jgi:serine protease Do
MIGINVAIASETGHNQGIAFAIPSNAVKEVFNQLLEKGEVVRGFLGVALQELPPGLEHQLGVGQTGGVIVTLVSDESPAQQAGIRKGDLIVRYNREPVGTANPVTWLRQRIARTPPDTTVPIEIARQQERFIVDVTVVKRPGRP